MDPEELDDVSTTEDTSESDHLLDQLMRKEIQIKTQEDLIEKLQNELENLRKSQAASEQFIRESKESSQKYNELLFKLEKQSHDIRELNIGFENIQQTNQSLSEELEASKRRVEELEALLQNQGVESKTDSFKAKMAEEMINVNNYSDELTVRENEMWAALERLSSVDNGSLASPKRKDSAANELVNNSSAELALAGNNRRYEQRIRELEEEVAKTKTENVQLQSKQTDLSTKLLSLEKEYESLLDDMIQREEERQQTTEETTDSLHELKGKLEAQYQTKREQQIKQIEELRQEILKKEAEIERCKNVMVDQKWQIEQLQTTNKTLESQFAETEKKAKQLQMIASNNNINEKDREVEELRNMMNHQIEEFNKVKEFMLRDLQNRCQKVVELEIQLDLARDQYQALLRSSSTKSQQKKMSLLEKNLQDVTAVHKQLVEQNAQLKKETAMQAKKMETRAERIHNLEILLQDSQERLERQEQKYEAEIRILQEKLSHKDHQTSSFNPLKFNFAEAKIAKPIRGGGSGAAEKPAATSTATSSANLITGGGGAVPVTLSSSPNATSSASLMNANTLNNANMLNNNSHPTPQNVSTPQKTGGRGEVSHGSPAPLGNNSPKPAVSSASSSTFSLFGLTSKKQTGS